MAREVIGSGFTENVKSQFKAREDLFSLKKRNNDQLLYMNSNGAWARLVSSVNTLTNEEIVKLAKFEVGPKDVEGSNKLAKFNVLLGGTKKQSAGTNNNNLKGGIDTTQNYTPIVIKDDLTITEGQLRTNQYNNYSSLGFRPTPGIDNVSIKSVGTYGTLREAVVKITAWTLEDLEVIQALYLRPGYSMLLEWGHSMYINNDGELNKDGVGALYNGFLDSKKQTPRKIEKDLTEKKEQHSGNYDAMYGYVKNFNWSFREDGGYDCEVTLISKGSVLESMSIKYDPENSLKTKNKEDSKNTRERVSPFHKFFNDIAKIKQTTFTKQDLLEKNSKEEEGNYVKLQDFNGYWIDLDTKGELDDFEDRGQFITLRTLLDFYNNYVAPGAPPTEDELDGGATKTLKYYTGQGEDLDGPYESISKYITTDSHFSINPMKGILPKAFTPPEVIVEYTTGAKIDNWIASFLLGTVTKFQAPNITINSNKENKLDIGSVNDIKKDLKRIIVKGESDDILNIFVSIHHLSIMIDNLLKNEQDTQHNMQQFVKDILTMLNGSLGGVNDLDQHYDETEDLWYIVDRKRTPTGSETIPPAELSLTGLKSTVTNLSISSKISNEIGAQVSIAAQGTGNNYKENVSAMLKWNSGLIDRTLPIKTITQEDFDKQNKDAALKEAEKIKKLIEWAEDVTDVFEEFSEGGEYSVEDVDYEEDKHTDLASGHKQYSARFVLEEYFKDPNDPKPPPGVVPVELSFTTIGIAGIKIGQAFTVADGILPKHYSENFGFIITGLSHDVSGNKWTTSIKTQFYSTKKPSKDELLPPRPATPPVTTITPEGITTVDPLTGIPATPAEIERLDPAPIINTRRIGGISYSASPLAKKLQSELNFNGLLPLSSLEPIGETQGAAKYYINRKTGQPEYMLHPVAAEAWYKWRDEMRTQGVNYSVSSGYRNSQHQGGLDSGRSASPGRSPHGWAGALDFGNLYQEVGGSTNLTTNVNGRIQSPDYTKMAEIGKKYGWYNPWRLSNNGGTMDELWHWEYWGNV